MRILYLLLTLFFCSSNYATSWLDKVKSNYKQIKEATTQKSELLSFPSDMPEEWHYSYINEPIFDSRIAVLQVGKKHKQSILLVHGLGELGIKDWYSTIPYLADKYHVIAIDLPGFGYSEKPQGDYSPTNYAQVLATVARKLTKNKLIVMGHSMGGAVSLRFASMYPMLVDKLILVDVAGVLHKTAFIKEASELPLQSVDVPQSLQKSVSQVNDFTGTLVEMMSMNKISESIENNKFTRRVINKSTNANAAFNLIEENFSEAISTIDLDTVIIWGENDRIAPLRTAKVLDKRMKKAKLSIIKEAGHVPMKTHQDLFLDILEKALTDNLKIPRIEKTLSAKQDLHCYNKDNKIYSGHYNTIIIENCSNIDLVDIVADKIIINDSLVYAENIMLNSHESALSVNESVLRITIGSIHTKEPIKLSGSRLDVAGVNIVSLGQSIKVSDTSKLIFSVSHIKEQLYQGDAHGAYEISHDSLNQYLN